MILVCHIITVTNPSQNFVLLENVYHFFCFISCTRTRYAKLMSYKHDVSGIPSLIGRWRRVPLHPTGWPTGWEYVYTMSQQLDKQEHFWYMQNRPVPDLRIYVYLDSFSRSTHVMVVSIQDYKLTFTHVCLSACGEQKFDVLQIICI